MTRSFNLFILLGCLLSGLPRGHAATDTQLSSSELFERGSQAYLAGGYAQSAALFEEAFLAAPSSGALHNLGNALWQTGRSGPAILAWERALWVNPFSANTRINLRFARKSAQLDIPDLTWFEICSTWLPVNTWAWIAAVSFWTALALVLLPGPLGWRKADWPQGVAAAGFAIFLLTLPAIAGVHARTRLGVALDKDLPLRLTPTRHGQVLARLPAGEMGRYVQSRGDYLYIRTSGAAGWVEKSQFGLLASTQPRLTGTQSSAPSLAAR